MVHWFKQVLCFELYLVFRNLLLVWLSVINMNKYEVANPCIVWLEKILYRPNNINMYIRFKGHGRSEGEGVFATTYCKLNVDLRI